MTSKNFFYFILPFLITLSSFLSAQSPPPVDQSFKAAVKKGTRSLSGRTGKAYWQNKSKYFLNIKFDPQTRLLTGNLEITYKNNSPDTLREVWFKLFQNLYMRGVNSKFKIEDKDLSNGVRIVNFQFNEKVIPPDLQHVDGTNMLIENIEVLPEATVQFEIDYNYTLNQTSHLRSGEVDSGSFFIAYFFPRIAVYDDIDGWNKYPYNGLEEFYNDFDDFDFRITVPSDYYVWATGELKNAKEVLSNSVYRRLESAETADSIIDVVTLDDIKNPMHRPPETTKIWHFEANEIPDVAFGISNHYLWKSTSVVVDSIRMKRSRIDVVYNKAHTNYAKWINYSRQIVSKLSFNLPKWPFPYPKIVVFDGLGEMEYPMLVNANPVEGKDEVIQLLSHEIMHSYFPFYLGINETKYAWMDEGWASLGEWLISSMVDSTIKAPFGIKEYGEISGDESDQPIMTLTTDLKKGGQFNIYQKPGMAYYFLIDYLGDKVFFSGLHNFIKEWQGKHPTPFDFFYSMNQGTGKDLDWYWKGWFYDRGKADLSIGEVKKKKNGYLINILNKGTKPIPVHLKIIFSDSSESFLNQTVKVWKAGRKSSNVFLNTRKIIKKVLLGNEFTPDKELLDNTYINKNKLH